MHGFVVIVTAFMFMCFSLSSLADEIIHAGNFSDLSHKEGFPEGWEPLRFEKITSYTEYALIEDEGIRVVQAVSKSSASGLARDLIIDIKQYPIIRWRWKVSNVYIKGDVTKKNGDDYPARIYVSFSYDPDRVGFFERAKFKMAKMVYGKYPPGSAINYIWASHAKSGAMVSNPYSDHVKMIVIESGKEALNTWVTEERNIYNDYVEAFGVEPPMMSGIAIMTDSDNTKESATAFYGDILFKKK